MKFDRKGSMSKENYEFKQRKIIVNDQIKGSSYPLIY